MGNKHDYRERYNRNYPVEISATIVGVEFIARVNKNIRFAAYQPHERSQWTTVRAYYVENGYEIYKEDFPTLSLREYMDLLHDFVHELKINRDE